MEHERNKLGIYRDGSPLPRPLGSMHPHHTSGGKQGNATANTRANTPLPPPRNPHAVLVFQPQPGPPLQGCHRDRDPWGQGPTHGGKGQRPPQAAEREKRIAPFKPPEGGCFGARVTKGKFSSKALPNTCTVKSQNDQRDIG